MEIHTTEKLWEIALGKRVGEAVREKPLRHLTASSVSELTATYKITPRMAERVSAVLELGRRAAEERLQVGKPFSSSHNIFAHFGPRMRDLRVEQFHAVYLDTKCRFMSDHLISQGTLASSPVHPREVFGPAIRMAAAAIVLVHNHPSGDPNPSEDDKNITRRLVEVGELIGIRIVDHLIVGDGYVSMADRGLLY